MKSFKENFGEIGTWLWWIWEKAKVLGRWFRSDWDSALILFVALWVLWSMFSAPAGAAYQVAPFREEERDRDEDEREERRRQHREMLDEQRRLYDQLRRRDNEGSADSSRLGGAGGGAGSGGWGIMDDITRRNSAHQAISAQDADPATGGSKEGESITDKISRLLKRWQNPMDRGINVLRQYANVK